MSEWLILAAVKVLKSAVLSALALVSWSVDAVDRPDGSLCVSAHAVVVCDVRDDAAIARGHARVALIRLLAVVPPIRVETLFSPAVLHPADALARPPDQAT
jgi:hypothetical protein